VAIAPLRYRNQLAAIADVDGEGEPFEVVP
jgi:hypothetical protein